MPSYTNSYFPQNTAGTGIPYNYNYNTYLTQPSTVSPPQATNVAGINWVQGEAGARSVPVSAGQKVLLMDSENNVFYVKASDMSGMPLPLRIFEYKEITNGTEQVSAPAQSTAGGYSRTGSKREMIEELKDMMKDTGDESIRAAISEAINKLDK